jgi:hypothetical protein
MAEVRLDLQQAPEAALYGLVDQICNRRLVAAFMSGAEDKFSRGAKPNGLLRAFLGQGQRFLAKDMLAGRRCSLDLRFVQIVRSGENDGINRGIRQHLVVRRREPDTHFRGKVGDWVGVRLYCPHEMQVIATGLDKLSYFAAPPSEADNGSLYLIHGIFHGTAASPEPRRFAINEVPVHSMALLGFRNAPDRERQYA